MSHVMTSSGGHNRTKRARAQARSSSSSSSAHHRHHRHCGDTSSARQVWAARILFIVCLSSVAVVLGFLAYFFITESETSLAEHQFESIADRALTEAAGIAERKRWSTVAMASTVSAMLPHVDDWPFVHVPEFERIVKNVLRTSAGSDMGFVPLVTLAQQSAWEDYAYDYFTNLRNFPNGTAESSFGRGIWFLNPNSDAPDHRFHVTTGDTVYGSPREILAPIFHVDEGANDILLFNAHSAPDIGRPMDDMLDCSETLEFTGAGASSDEYRCGVITGKIKYQKYQNFGPTSMIFQPIYPANNRTTIVGFISTPVLWDWILENVFADNVNGVDCVLRMGEDVSTYTVTGGVAEYRGEGDFYHLSRYQHLERTAVLTGGDIYTENSPTYELSVFPNDDFYQEYNTANPMVATMGAVVAVLITSAFFFLYDFLVRRAFSAKRHTLEAKRQFMRFVSHEVRTPLNAVSMGLTVLQVELAASLGYDSPADVAIVELMSNQHEISKVDSKGASEDEEKDSSDDQRSSRLEWFQLAQEIQSNAQSAVDVLSDLLNYDKIEQGNLSLELTGVSIWKLIEQTSNEFKLCAAKKKIDLKLEFLIEADATDEEQASPSSTRALPKEMDGLKLIGDSVRLSQVLRNLISNALKFTPAKGTVRVQAVWRQQKLGNAKDSQLFELKNGKKVSAETRGVIHVHVKDSGVGLSEDQLKVLFRDGIQFNVNELQAGQGSGLGLYIAQGIVKQHRGAIEADSEGDGQGTTFTMTLPVYDLPETEREKGERMSAGAGQPPKSDSSGGVSPLLILIVDDASSNRKLLHRLLKRKGHICDEAENGAIAVDMFVNATQAGNPYDTILMDYEMPEMNGPDAAAAIREKGSDVFIVGITGNMLPEDVAFFRSKGANAVMSKPFNMSDLEEWWMECGVSSGGAKDDDELIQC